jgi:gastrin-releasing peptide receptor
MEVTNGNSSSFGVMNSTDENLTIDMELYESTRNAVAVFRIVVPIIFVILMLVGVVGNGVLIYTVFANKCMRNTPNILIVSLSIGDMVLLLMSAPFSSIHFTLDEYPFGELVCRGNEYLQNLSVGVSVFTLTALSGDRFFAIVFPMSKHKGKPKLKLAITVASIWILSALLAIPEAINMKIVENGGNEYCYYDSEEFTKTFTMVKFTVLFLVPLLIIGFFYCMMAVILVTSSRRIPCEPTTGSAVSRQQQRQVEARVKVAKVVLSFVFLFILCWLPRYVYLLWFYWADEGTMTIPWMVLKVSGFCLMYVYSSINPYALYFLSSQFRRYYNKYLFRCCPKSYRPIQPESASAMLYNGTVRRGSTSMTMIKAHSEV